MTDIVPDRHLDRQAGRQAGRQQAAGSSKKTVVCLCIFRGGTSLLSGRESKDSTWCFCRNLPNVRNPLPTPRTGHVDTKQLVAFCGLAISNTQSQGKGEERNSLYRRAYPYSPNHHAPYRTVFVSINGLARTFTEILISQCTCYTLYIMRFRHIAVSRVRLPNY